MYNQEFLKKRKDKVYKSARNIVPIILNEFKIKSVVDIGCANGLWLSVFNEFGIEDYLGLDGHWIKREDLMIPNEKFKPFDLNNSLDLNKKFDLAISIEVAEHLPEIRAKSFISNICNLADIVLFSAAVPFQEGEGHINCQWQSYWRNIFSDNGFIAIDILRPKIWNNKDVNMIYSQNMFIYINKDLLVQNKEYSILKKYSEIPFFSIINPRFFNNEIEKHKRRQKLFYRIKSRVGRIIKRK